MGSYSVSRMRLRPRTDAKKVGKCRVAMWIPDFGVSGLNGVFLEFFSNFRELFLVVSQNYVPLLRNH